MLNYSCIKDLNSDVLADKSYEDAYNENNALMAALAEHPTFKKLALILDQYKMGQTINLEDIRILVQVASAEGFEIGRAFEQSASLTQLFGERV